MSYRAFYVKKLVYSFQYHLNPARNGGIFTDIVFRIPLLRKLGFSSSLLSLDRAAI